MMFQSGEKINVLTTTSAVVFGLGGLVCAAARNVSGMSIKERLRAIVAACDEFDKNTHTRYGEKEEW